MKLSHKLAAQPEPKERSERGFMLLEVLVSILLFALGIVALVGLQARSLEITDDVQYRAEAVHLAEAYIGKIWAVAGGLTGPQIVTQFSSAAGQAEYSDFSNRVTGSGSYAGLGIPGAQAPVVIITNRSAQFDLPASAVITLPSVDVQIQINWTDREGVMHGYTQSSSIGLGPI